jgi:O-antigen ligase
MNTQRLGFMALIAYLLVDFGQVHRMIPGLSLLKPGAVTTVVLLALVLLELPRQLHAPGGGWLRPVVVWRLLFLGAIATGLVFAVTQGRALMVLKTELPRFLTAFLGACLFVRRARDLRILQNMFIGLAFLISAWVITHGGHGPGLYVDENDAALVLVMLLPFSCLKVFSEEGGLRNAVVPLGVFFITLTAIGLTLSRGGMVGCIPALAFCWFKSRNKAVSLAFGAVALAGALVFAPAQFKTEFVSIADTHESTADARRYYWDLSVQMFEKRPLLGVGAMCWGNALYSGVLSTPDRRAHMTPHSIYFQALAELGLLGVFCWMGFLTASFRELRGLRRVRLEAGARMALGDDPDPFAARDMARIIRRVRYFAAALAIGMVGYLVCGAFLSELFYPGIALFAALAQGAGRVWRTELLVASLTAREAETGPAPVPARPGPRLRPVPGDGAIRPQGRDGLGGLAMGRAEP